MLAGMVYSYYKFRRIVVSLTINPFLGGLVSITANCDVIQPYDAVIIGMTSFGAYAAGQKFLEFFEIDDPLSAVPVHGFCGIYAMLMTGFFSHETGIFYTGKFEALGVQLAATLFIIGFTGVLTLLFLLFISKFEPLRVKPYEEDVGLDFSEHGCHAIEVARTKLIQSFIYYCDTLDHKDARNPFRNLLNAVDIDADQFSRNWNLFKDMFAQQSEIERQTTEIHMAAMLDFRDDDEKALYIKQQTANLNKMGLTSDDEEFSESRKVFVKAMTQNTAEEQALQKSLKLTHSVINDSQNDKDNHDP